MNTASTPISFSALVLAYCLLHACACWTVTLRYFGEVKQDLENLTRQLHPQAVEEQMGVEFDSEEERQNAISNGIEKRLEKTPVPMDFFDKPLPSEFTEAQEQAVLDWKILQHLYCMFYHQLKC